MVVVAPLEEQVKLLAEQGVVVAQVRAEDAEGFGERAAADGDLGTAATDQVDGGEVLVDPYGSRTGRTVTPLVSRMRLVRLATAARTTAGEDTAKSRVWCSPSANTSRPRRSARVA